MAAPTLCIFNKFGFCKFGERCRRHHRNTICQERSCEITSCRQRHPKICKYFRNFGRCKFDPCAFKHEVVTKENIHEDVVKEIKVISEKIASLESEIINKNQQIEEMSNKINNLERKLDSQTNEKVLLEKLEEKLKYFEEKFELVDKTTETFSNFVRTSCSSIDDLVVELNDDIGNITIENDDENDLTRTFENPFSLKCNICEFVAKSERGLKSHKTRKHENCNWCDFICEERSEMEKHKMGKHTIQYSKEVLEGYMGKSP